jgi:hypothetical protein
MGISFYSLSGAVTFQTGLAVDMASLAGLEIPQRLPPML